MIHTHHAHARKNTQALNLLKSEEDVADKCKEDLVEIVSLLPYLGGVHDPGCVMDACKDLGNKMEDEGNTVAQAMCRAVGAYFMPRNKREQQEEAIEEVGHMVAGEGVEVEVPGGTAVHAARRHRPLPLMPMPMQPNSLSTLCN